MLMVLIHPNGDTLVYDGTDFGFVNFNSETNHLIYVLQQSQTTDLTGFEGELTGDLITGQNRIAFADTGTVSFQILLLICLVKTTPLSQVV